MNFKLIGALLVIVGCGGFGFATAASQRREERTLKQLLNILEYFSCELQYRLTPLPQLCRQAALECNGTLAKVFTAFADELDMQLTANPELCMKVVLEKHNDIPQYTYEILAILGRSLGRFNLDGQLMDLERVCQECKSKMSKLSEGKETRIRTYQTLGLCAGAALAILLI